jgi:formylglycine-generating enzyme required for sulfatase activity
VFKLTSKWQYALPISKLGCVWIFCWAVTTLACASEPVQPAKPQDHFHVNEDCKSCHPDGFDLATVLSAPDMNCLRCHTEAKFQQAVKRLANSGATEPAPEQQKLAPGAGMRYPQFYLKSRLGPEPNEMVLIPAGPFIRGTNNRLFDEGPQHTVNLPAFWIDRYEVTNLQYKKFIDATKRRSPSHFRNRTFPQGKADHPVTFVSWYDAKAYCEWAGKRLPTDVEWEKAARGTDGREYPWGNELVLTNANMPMRWQAIGLPGDTTPVGAFENGKSPYGLYDMSGNVWEWTASWYKSYPGNTTASENFGERYKTLKGGSWFDCSFYRCGISAPVYNRAFFAQNTKNDTFGFRCAKDASQHDGGTK